MELINENTFDKTFNTVVRVLPIPEIAEEVIIATKDFLKNEEVREKIKNIFDNTLNKDGRIIKNISQIKDTIKEEGLKDGISETIDIVINNLKKSKQIDKNTANLLKDSKDVIIDKAIDNEIENRYKGQEKILNNINEKYTKWENEFKNMNIENMNKIHNLIKNEYKKLIPTVEIIDKIKEMENLNKLAENKIKSGQNNITDIEKEICRKAG